MKFNFNILVNSQMQCSHVIQAQAQKCDGMHINFDAICQGDSKFARKSGKTQTALISSIFSNERTRHFVALTHNLSSAHTQVFKINYKYIKLIAMRTVSKNRLHHQRPPTSLRQELQSCRRFCMSVLSPRPENQAKKEKFLV